MLGKRTRAVQKTTSTSHVTQMAEDSCLEKERFSHDRFVSRKNCGGSNGCVQSPLSAIQYLIANYFRKVQPRELKTASVGLSIVIETCCRNDRSSVAESNKQIIKCSRPHILSKCMLVSSECKSKNQVKNGYQLPMVSIADSVIPQLPAIDFLDSCFLCKRPLGPGRDIYIYRGDRAFCSVDCRWQHMLTDERSEKCASAALKPVAVSSSGRSGRRRTRGPSGGMATAA